MSKTNTALDRLSEKDLHHAIRAAKTRMREIDAASNEDVYRRGDQLLDDFAVAVATVHEASDQLRRREGARRSLTSRVLHHTDPVTWAVQTAALALGGGVEVDPSRLSEDEAEEVRALVERWPELSGDERLRVEGLIGKAAGDERVFADRRTRAQMKSLAAEARRLPQGESLVAAVLSDPFLFDGLRHRVRDDAVEVDEYGHTTTGATGVLFDLDSVAVLVLCLHLIAENDGKEIVLGEHGSFGGGLPLIPPASLTQLRRNGLVTVRHEGVSVRVGYGRRAIAIARKWGIEVPDEEASPGTAAAA